VLAANSSKWPGSGTPPSPTSGTVSWESKYNGYGTGNNNINVKGWQINSSGDTNLVLKFTVDFSSCPNTPQATLYSNVAKGILGQTGLPPLVEVEVTAPTLNLYYPCTTLAVTLADFSAVQQGDAVLLTWETNSELDNRGFNLYRGTSDAGPDRQLNEALIPSQSPGNPGGFVYTWEDHAGLQAGTTYFYWVEDVDGNGATTMHGPVSVDFTVPTAVTLGDLNASPAAASALPVAGVLLALLAQLAGVWAVRRRA
jgi:hypothetical protein